MGSPVQAEEESGRQIPLAIQDCDAERIKSSEAAGPAVEKSRYCLHGTPYRKPTQVDEERILRPAGEALFKELGKMTP